MTAPPPKVRLRTRSADATFAAGRVLAAVIEIGDVVALDGGLGAGKTVFVKGIAAGLGVHETVTSPTFAIVQEYEGRVLLTHMDLYRIDSRAELGNVGFFDALDDDAVCVIEWAERASGLLPEHHLSVVVAEDGAPDRRVIELGGPRHWTDRLAALRPAWNDAGVEVA
jgi:tRNA threonylcarbamoyladenosine biosynthesis protein TsaE